MTDGLRDRLIASDGFGDALSALRADRAVAVVAEWLRAEARAELNVPETAHSRAMRRVERANALIERADFLAKTTGGTDGR